MPDGPRRPILIRMERNRQRLNPEDLALIARFRGLPQGPVRRTRPPRTMDSAVRQFYAIHRLGGNAPEATILENWEKLVGPAFASRCQPIRIRQGSVLVLAVENPTLRQEIAFQKKRILEQVRSLPGCSGIRDLSVRG